MIRSLTGTVLAALAGAQQIVVPAVYADRDAPSSVWVAGAVLELRQQFIVDAWHLTGLAGRQLTAVSLRRDTGARHVQLDGARPKVRVVVASAPHAASDARAEFAANLGPDAATVFDGPVDVPASPPVSPGARVPWDGQHSVRIQFAQPFTYAGGPLCIELLGDPQGTQGERWQADAASDPVRGILVEAGTACGPFASPGERTADGEPRALVPGGEAYLHFEGTPDGSAILAIALGVVPNALSLGFLGTDPACHLHLSGIVATVPAAIGPRAVPLARRGGDAAVQLPLPMSTAMAGARFAVQWFDLGPPVAASNALDCTVAASRPAVGLAHVSRRIVNGRLPSVGRVDATRGPVLRLEYR